MQQPRDSLPWLVGTITCAVLTLLWPSAFGADLSQGQKLYRAHCASCHGVRGVPVMPGAPDFTRQQTLMQPDPVLVDKLKQGKGAMPAYQGLLRERELYDIVAYMRTLK
jgi:cytochrome c6